MKTSIITLALLMGFSSHAQIQSPQPIPKVWQCSADCFTIGGNDGTNLYYYGKMKGYAYLSQKDAFDSLKESCSGNALLLKRKFKSIYNQSTVENVFERNVIYYYHAYSERVKTYQVINTQSKIQFDVSEADLNNSCEQVELQQLPINNIGGDPTLG